MTDPVGLGKLLRYSLKGHRRLRVGNYRVVYRIEPQKHLIIIAGIKHRNNIYED
jgi:mRNA interferase RelE/StbE